MSVSVDGDSVCIDLSVILGYGIRINEVARMIADEVRYTVENATGLKVIKVTVNVQGIRPQGRLGELTMTERVLRRHFVSQHDSSR